MGIKPSEITIWIHMSFRIPEGYLVLTGDEPTSFVTFRG